MPLVSRRSHLLAASLLCAFSASAVHRVDAAERAGGTEQQAIDQLKTLLVPSPYRIPDHALTGRIRYEVALSDNAGESLPETGEQHVERKADHLVVTICAAGCGHEAAPTSADLDHYLQPNPWVKSGDPVIARFAAIGPSGGPVAKRMPLLVVAVSKRMTGPIEFLHYWTAREAYDKQGGDCTEWAVLLAAAARARGIPTRVVYGMAYSGQFMGVQHVFVPHMWVQSWDGERWVSYDAALGAFDAGHVALVLGDGSPAGAAAMNAMIRKLHIIDAAALAPVAAAQ